MPAFSRDGDQKAFGVSVKTQLPDWSMTTMAGLQWAWRTGF